MNIIEENEKKLLAHFSRCKNPQEIYQILISLSIKLPSLPPDDKIEKNRIHGCQSQLYLIHSGSKEALTFQADSDALISKGLAYTLTTLYNGASAEAILKTTPTYYKKISLHSIISPTRLNGLAELEKAIKQTVINYLI